MSTRKTTRKTTRDTARTTVRRTVRRGIAALVAGATVLVGGLVAVATAPAAAAAPAADTWYVLVNRNSGKALDVYNLSLADKADIVQWPRNDGAQQQWRFLDSGGGYYRLQSRLSGKVLDVLDFSTANGGEVVQFEDRNGTNQQWRVTESGGYATLVNRNSGKALEVQGASTADAANVVQYDSWGGANQQWQLVPVDDVAPSALPSSFSWSSSGVLAGPKPDATHPSVAIKDFSVIRYGGQWQVYATTASRNGWGLVHFAFTDWADAKNATYTYLDTSGIGPGYRAAPQVFQNSRDGLWYMVYQTGPPTYSTTTDPSNPRSWSAPKPLIANEPAIVTQNKGDGQWIDFWNVCDDTTCYLYFSDDNGHMYRARTSVEEFPNGFGDTELFMSDTKNNLFEASNVYRVDGSDEYLMIVEAIGSTGRRYFRSWTATDLGGAWTPLASTESSPFAGRANVSFPGGAAWTQDFSHGELVRSANDETLPISPCRLQYVYQGIDPSAGGDYLLLPWRMGLLTQTNSTC